MGSLVDLKHGRVTAGLERLTSSGVMDADWRRMLEDDALLKRIVETWKVRGDKKIVPAKPPRRRKGKKLPARPITDAEKAEWEKFYLDHLGLTIDLTGLVVPSHRKEFSRVLVVATGLTLNKVLAACKAKFAVYSDWGDDLDKAITVNDRVATASYAICVRNVVEADECWKSTKADTLKKRKIIVITLLERLVLELKFFAETGVHLDVTNITLCDGSRSSVGGVPRVDWDFGKLCVVRCYSDEAHPNIRAREAAVS